MGYAAVDATLRTVGLTARGGFHPEPADAVPPLPDGAPAGTLVLAGNVGPAMFESFAAAPERRDGGADPLDRWSRRVLEEIAGRLGARALFPFGGPPWLPFQRWARRAEPLAVSPLGVLIHPTWGLWHAYRGALAFVGHLELPAREPAASPCDGCADKPCLSACPVGAFSGAGYDVAACAGHLAVPAGRDCLAQGCRARLACPVGRDHLYEPAQARFHMAAFQAARARGG